MSEAKMMQEWEDEISEGFHITDDGGAAWAVRKIREADEELDSLIRWYQSRIEIAKAKRDATVERMTAYLRDYADMVPMRETKMQKSYPIPGGKLVLKKATTKLEHDDETILRVLKDQGRDDMIKRQVVERVDWMSLKKELLETGEIFEGVTTVEVPEIFIVQIEKED